MKKTDLRQIAADCGANYQALKEQLKADGLCRKTATANTLLDTTRLTNNVIQCERDGLEIVHIEIPNEGKRPFMQYAIKA